MDINRYVVFTTTALILFLSVHLCGSAEGFGGGSDHFRDVNAAILYFTTTQNDLGDDISFINLSIVGNFTSDLVNENTNGINISDGEIIRVICHPYHLYGLQAGDLVIVNISRHSNLIHSLNLTFISWELRSIRDNNTINNIEDELITPDDPEKDEVPSVGIQGILISMLFSVLLIKRKVYDRGKPL